MKTAKNDVTGDAIKSKANSDAYRNAPFWDNVEKERSKCKCAYCKCKKEHPEQLELELNK